MSGLVDYDYSDSDQEQEEETQHNGPNSNGIKKEDVESGSTSTSSAASVLKNLPKIQQNQAKPKSSLFLKDVIKRSSDGRIQIKALDISDDDESDIEEEQERERKRVKPSDKGCGLFSMLPEPKQKITKMNTNDKKLPAPSGLVPKSVSDRQKAPIFKPDLLNMDISKNKHHNHDDDYDDDDDDDDDTESFFFTKHKPIIPDSSPSTSFMTTNNANLNQEEYGPSRPQAIDNEYYDQAQASSSSSSSHNINDDFAYKRMIANKFGDDEPSNVNIIDFDMGQHLRDNKEWIKNISKESETVEDSQINGPAPNSAAKRRNQITYLAYQAKKREVELKNQWAANRQTMQQARSRYGF